MTHLQQDSIKTRDMLKSPNVAEFKVDIVNSDGEADVVKDIDLLPDVGT